MFGTFPCVSGQVSYPLALFQTLCFCGCVSVDENLPVVFPATAFGIGERFVVVENLVPVSSTLLCGRIHLFGGFVGKSSTVAEERSHSPA